MKSGLKAINKVLQHSKISDENYLIQQLDIDGYKEGNEDQWNVEKLNPSWHGSSTALSKKNRFINRKDNHSHGHED